MLTAYIQVFRRHYHVMWSRELVEIHCQIYERIFCIKRTWILFRHLHFGQKHWTQILQRLEHLHSGKTFGKSPQIQISRACQSGNLSEIQQTRFWFLLPKLHSFKKYRSSTKTYIEFCCSARQFVFCSVSIYSHPSFSLLLPQILLLNDEVSRNYRVQMIS